MQGISLNPSTTWGQALQQARGGGTSSDPPRKDGEGGAAAPAARDSAQAGCNWEALALSSLENCRWRGSQKTPQTTHMYLYRCVKKETESNDYFS